MTDSNEDLILKHFNGTLSTEESERFENWLSQSDENRRFANDLQQVWKLTGSDRPIVNIDEDKEWSRLEDTLQDQKVVRFPLTIYKVASAILVMIVAGGLLYFYRSPDLIAVTANDESKVVSLPDGSTVWLNQDSRLSYQTDFNENRNLELEGEGFFDVKRNHDKPFVVSTLYTKVKVLGTSFNVNSNAANHHVEVFVVTGKVGFSSGADEVKLTPGLTGIYNKQQNILSIDTALQQNVLAWRDKHLVFKKTPLMEVIKTLRAYFRKDIQLKSNNLENCRFTSDFRNPTLEEVMEVLSLSLNLNVNHQSDHYLLDGEGCDTL